jgi:hypothetical protein
MIDFACSCGNALGKDGRHVYNCTFFTKRLYESRIYVHQR